MLCTPKGHFKCYAPPIFGLPLAIQILLRYDPLHPLLDLNGCKCTLSIEAPDGPCGSRRLVYCEAVSHAEVSADTMCFEKGYE